MPSNVNPATVPDYLVLKENALRAVISSELAVAKNVLVPTLQTMTKRFMTQKSILWNADLGGTGVQVVDVDEDSTTDDSQGDIEPASLQIGNTAIKHKFTVNSTEVTQARAIAAPSELKNLFRAKVNRGLLKIMRELNKNIYAGDGTKTTARMLGLEKVTDPAYAYAGIDGNLHTGWNSVLNVDATATPRELTSKMLRSFDTALQNAETTYDVIYTTPELGEKYADLFAAQRSFSGRNDGPDRADLGIQGLTYNGRPIIEDPMCTPGTMYFVDSSELFLHSYRVDGDAILDGMAIYSGMLGQSNIYAESWEIGILPQIQVFNRKGVNAIKHLA